MIAVNSYPADNYTKEVVQDAYRIPQSSAEIRKRIRINSNNTPGKLWKTWKNINKRKKGKQFLGEISLIAGTSESVVRQKVPRSMPALYFTNEFDKSTMTGLEIVSIAAIYQDKNEITVFWFWMQQRWRRRKCEAKRVERECRKSWFEVRGHCIYQAVGLPLTSKVENSSEVQCAETLIKKLLKFYYSLQLWKADYLH